eukprot:TRINITY_DN556_c0_g3_i2.p2 TRINITY_DN556_c0_g3~~TRINITY_DN556_c0_g3_i2.p2  ORF type:complete len:161 (-),score=18.66 TRINITY_DN556_c0_g3_i2:72-554(-)
MDNLTHTLLYRSAVSKQPSLLAEWTHSQEILQNLAACCAEDTVGPGVAEIAWRLVEHYLQPAVNPTGNVGGLAIFVRHCFNYHLQAGNNGRLAINCERLAQRAARLGHPPEIVVALLLVAECAFRTTSTESRRMRVLAKTQQLLLVAGDWRQLEIVLERV